MGEGEQSAAATREPGRIVRLAKTILSILFSIIGFAMALFLVHLPHGFEHWSADLRTLCFSDRRDGQYPSITIVEVNEKIVDRHQFASPINRKLISNIIKAVDQEGASVIGLDFIFDRHSIKEEDDDLIETIQKARAKIVLGIIDERTPIDDTRAAYQANFVERTGRPKGHLYFGAGHSDHLTINADVVRTFSESGSHHGTSNGTKSFAEVVAREYGMPPAAAPSWTSRFASLFVDGSPHIAWLLPPRNGSNTFTPLSADAVMKARELQVEDKLRGRIVLIGGRFLDRDLHLTPLSVRSEARYPGVAIHAQIIAQLLDGRSVYVLARWVEWVLGGAFVLVGFFAGYRLRGSHHWIEFTVLFAYLVFTVIVFWVWKLIFPFVTVFLAFGLGFAAGHSAHGASSRGRSNVGHARS